MPDRKQETRNYGLHGQAHTDAVHDISVMPSQEQVCEEHQKGTDHGNDVQVERHVIVQVDFVRGQLRTHSIVAGCIDKG